MINFAFSFLTGSRLFVPSVGGQTTGPRSGEEEVGSDQSQLAVKKEEVAVISFPCEI
ncbi:hypothetical protein SAMN05444280_11385 [Tangfeifania diversioriginum]|uniref:Uncharacterized protein n=1 Tax=Tangfeifania diversioriginum TaxID=1168035 RepID=A0A1M6HGX5_9BACT|nr:hypothetical protein SAMN05444280_11385 [Tangfeifania diversioriginum]